MHAAASAGLLWLRLHSARSERPLWRIPCNQMLSRCRVVCALYNAHGTRARISLSVRRGCLIRRRWTCGGSARLAGRATEQVGHVHAQPASAPPGRGAARLAEENDDDPHARQPRYASTTPMDRVPAVGRAKGIGYQLIGEVDQYQPGHVEIEPVRGEPAERVIQQTANALI